MCTAISVTAGNNYFGRNLDFGLSYGEKVVITPKNYKFLFRNGKVLDNHYAMIGMAIVDNGYPLYFDATNEVGLSMAGLRFAGSCVYMSSKDNKDNVASFEFIPWILSQCKTTRDAEELLSKINITDESFSEKLKPSPLHWIISDREHSITVEQTRDGLQVFKNPVGVLTNNPTFDIQMFNLNNYMSLSTEDANNNFSVTLDLTGYGAGMGAIGLPGDYSSMSRFVKTCFLRENLVYGVTEEEIVNQFFHILYSVFQANGIVKANGEYQITYYTSCCNAEKGIYYYTTYNNTTINAVSLYAENLDGDTVISYDLIKEQPIKIQNSI